MGPEIETGVGVHPFGNAASRINSGAASGVVVGSSIADNRGALNAISAGVFGNNVVGASAGGKTFHGGVGGESFGVGGMGNAMTGHKGGNSLEAGTSGGGVGGGSTTMIATQTETTHVSQTVLKRKERDLIPAIGNISPAAQLKLEKNAKKMKSLALAIAASIKEAGLLDSGS